MQLHTTSLIGSLQDMADSYHNVDYQSSIMLGDQASAAAFIRVAIDIQKLLVTEYDRQKPHGKKTIEAFVNLIKWEIKRSRIEEPGAKVPKLAYELAAFTLQKRLPPTVRQYLETVIDAYDFHDLNIEDNPFRI